MSPEFWKIIFIGMTLAILLNLIRSKRDFKLKKIALYVVIALVIAFLFTMLISGMAANIGSSLKFK